MKKLLSTLLAVMVAMTVICIPTPVGALGSNVDRNIIKKNVAKIVNYVDENGYINQNGDRTVAISVDEATYYVNHNGDTLNFGYMLNDQDNRLLNYGSMVIQIPYSESTTAQLQLLRTTNYSSYKVHATVDPSTFKDADSVNIIIDNTDFANQTTINLSKASLNLAIAGWDLLLKGKMEMGIEYLGFSQRCTHSWGPWRITKAPTDSAAGTKARTCQHCGLIASQSVPAFNGVKLKSVWASKHEVGKVTFKWTKKDGATVGGWQIKYRTRKIGGVNKWSSWKNVSYAAAKMQATISVPKNYVIELHAKAKGDKTWSTGIITTPAGGKYQAMKTVYVKNASTNKRIDSISLKVGQTIKLKPDYEYPVKDYKARPRLYPTHMLYDIGNKNLITITKPNGAKYTGGIIDGTATVKAVKRGTTTLICRAPNGRTKVLNVTVK